MQNEEITCTHCNELPLKKDTIFQKTGICKECRLEIYDMFYYCDEYLEQENPITSSLTKH